MYMNKTCIHRSLMALKCGWRSDVEPHHSSSFIVFFYFHLFFGILYRIRTAVFHTISANIMQQNRLHHAQQRTIRSILVLLVVCLLFSQPQTTDSLLLPHVPNTRPTSSSSALFSLSVDVWEGPWDTKTACSTFRQEYWGQKPLLVRQAFDASSSIFPSYPDIVDLAIDEDDAGISSRLVQHTAGDLTSFSLELGPFDPDELEGEFDDKTVQTTLLVNDVDRRRPDLADWMEEQFAFLPRWRIDDAQISIAQEGGGIGPHVDNYDVFLIQTSGQRQWSVGTEKLSTADEYAALVPDIPVRILQMNYDSVEYLLEPGDMLYLPPRVIHCGTAASEQCVTLSVGCRAPSAAELMARVAEKLQDTATERYKDVSGFGGMSSSSSSSSKESLTAEVKTSMKEMVLRSIHSLLEDDAAWDELVGGIITEPIRDDDFGPSHDDDKIMEQSLREMVQNSNYYMKRSPGISVATSIVEMPGLPASYRLFAHGLMWESQDFMAQDIFRRIEQGLGLSSEHVKAALESSPEIESILKELFERRLVRFHRCID